jgi:hypothetical protein
MSSPTFEQRPAVPVRDARTRIGALIGDLLPDAGLLAVFAATRLIVVAAAFAAEFLIIRNPLLTSGASGPIVTSLTSWDGWYYLGIARDGYLAAPVADAYSNVAFPPLFPLLIRVLALPFPAYQGLVGIVVANVAFLVALGLMVRLGTPFLGRRRASLAAALLAIYPFASAFAMVYTESLFLMLILAAYLAAERGHRAWAGIFLALASLCRLQGVALVLPLAILMLRQDGWRPRPSLAWLLLAPLAAGGFLVYVGTVTGSVAGYLDAQQAWGRQGLGGSGSSGSIAAMFTPYQAMLLLTLLWSVFLLVFVRVDGIRPEYWLIPVLFIAAELSSGSLEAVGRVTMTAFPYAWILARRRSLLGRRVWPMVSLGLFALVALVAFGGFWVP